MNKTIKNLNQELFLNQTLLLITVYHAGVWKLWNRRPDTLFNTSVGGWLTMTVSTGANSSPHNSR